MSAVKLAAAVCDEPFAEDSVMIFDAQTSRPNSDVQTQYKTDAAKWGHSFRYGGPFIVRDHRNNIYEHESFYQIVDQRWKVEDFEVQPKRQKEDKALERRQVEVRERHRR